MNEAVERKIIKNSRSVLPVHLEELTSVLSGKTGKSTAGFPFVAEESFSHFLNRVPHLFRDGNLILDWLSNLRADLDEDNFTQDEYQDILASIRVVETVVHTAAVTSVPDCWVLRWVLSVWSKAGALDLLKSGPVAVETIKARLAAEDRLFQNDLSLLICRGIVEKHGDLVHGSAASGKQIIAEICAIEPDFPADLTAEFAAIFASATPPQSARILVQKFLLSPVKMIERTNWCPTISDIELGYRLTPLVLALRLNGQSEKLRVNRDFKEVVAPVPDAVRELLHLAGYIDNEYRVTRLGDRVFSRGPGPIGIIHAYHPYMAKLADLIKGTESNVWVERGKNVAASQDANRKTFELGNQSLDAFCKQTSFNYNVFIEHAVGQGEATRQRYRRPEGDTKQYFGADLEDAAINAALAQQQSGILPPNMQFVRHADIGYPHLVVDAIQAAGFKPDGAVMMVGNGFHEIRNQSNEKMVEAFRGYCAAGILLIFTEESGLSDFDLLSTGWNTYHAGFRYVHELSGQGLRPAIDRDDAPGRRFSWGKCASIAGYQLLKSFTTRTRKIFPHPRSDGYNPAISVNYFCVPAAIAQQLKLDDRDVQRFD